jgi:hypothetical protein
MYILPHIIPWIGPTALVLLVASLALALIADALDL